jgi:hypothetical protein
LPSRLIAEVALTADPALARPYMSGLSQADLTVLEQRRQQLAADRPRYVEAHALRAGGLVLANQYSGLDTSQPGLSARHLVARSMIAQNAGLRETDDLVRAGLLHPGIGRYMRPAFQGYLDGMRSILNSFVLLAKTDVGQVGPLIIAGALDRSREFVEAHADKLTEVARSVAAESA